MSSENEPLTSVFLETNEIWSIVMLALTLFVFTSSLNWYFNVRTRQKLPQNMPGDQEVSRCFEDADPALGHTPGEELMNPAIPKLPQ